MKLSPLYDIDGYGWYDKISSDFVFAKYFYLDYTTN